MVNYRRWKSDGFSPPLCPRVLSFLDMLRFFRFQRELYGGLGGKSEGWCFPFFFPPFLVLAFFRYVNVATMFHSAIVHHDSRVWHTSVSPVVAETCVLCDILFVLYFFASSRCMQHMHMKYLALLLWYLVCCRRERALRNICYVLAKIYCE